MKRKEVLSRSHKRLSKMCTDKTLPTVPLPQTNQIPKEGNKKLNLHLRSRTRIIRLSPKAFEDQYYQTPTSFLPRIRDNSVNALTGQQSSEIDTLQTYVHTLLLKNLKQYQVNKELKSLQENIDKKKQDIVTKSDENKKVKQKSRLQQLRLKLGELYGQLHVQENKLKIQYAVEERMEKKYNGYYDKLTRKAKGTDTVDVAQNTELTNAVVETSEIKGSKDTKKSKLLSKFRVAAYAVYFSIIFPKYSKAFPSIMKQKFVQKILNKNSITTSIQQCYKLFQMMKLKLIWTQLEYKNLAHTDQNVSIRLETQSYNFKMENINTLLKFVLNGILKSIKAGQIDVLIELFPLMLMNNSYITDTLFLQQQLYNIKINKQTSSMNLTQGQEKCLLLNLLLVKITAFSFMMNNSYITERPNKYIFAKTGTNQFNNLAFPISRQLLVCGLYLVYLCNKVNKKTETKPSSDSYVESLPKEESPLPMPSLEIDHRIAMQKEGSSKRTSIQDGISGFKESYVGIQLKNIKNLPLLLQCFDVNNGEPDLLALITQIRDEAYQKAVNFKKQLYKQIQVSYLQVKNKQDLHVFHFSPERSEQDKQKIEAYCKQFRQKRENQRQLNVRISETTKQGNKQTISSQSSHLSEDLV